MRYDLKRFEAEIKYRDRAAIKTGCGIFDDSEPETVKSFTDKDEAMHELASKKYLPTCYYYEGGRCYEVTEYAVEAYEVDDDGEFLSGSDYDHIYDYHFNEETGDIIIGD